MRIWDYLCIGIHGYPPYIYPELSEGFLSPKKSNVTISIYTPDDISPHDCARTRAPRTEPRHRCRHHPVPPTTTNSPVVVTFKSHRPNNPNPTSNPHPTILTSVTTPTQRPDCHALHKSPDPPAGAPPLSAPSRRHPRPLRPNQSTTPPKIPLHDPNILTYPFRPLDTYAQPPPTPSSTASVSSAQNQPWLTHSRPDPPSRLPHRSS